MPDVSYWILNMSLSASAVGLVVLLLTRIYAIPRRAACVLWALPYLRMFLPLSFSGEFGLMWLFRDYIRSVPIGNMPDWSFMNSVQLAEDYFPISYKTSVYEAVFTVAFYVWAVVFLALLITVFVLYFLTKAEMKDAPQWKDNIYYSEKIASPAVYGVFHPRIILPHSVPEADIDLILLHEKTHIRRGDNLWRMIVVLITLVHWFNPISWVFLKSFLTDLELACDESVLAKCGEEQKKRYATSLLNSIEAKTVFTSAFGGAKVRVRIDRILSYRRLTLISALFFIELIVVMTYFLLANAPY